MLLKDVLGRIFCLRIGVSAATGFAIDIEKRQYLVTSRKFAMGASPRAPLLVLLENQWYNLGGTVIGHAPGEVDISVIVLNSVVAKPDLELVPDPSLLYGQDVLLFGYPYGWWGDTKKAFLGRPIPFVRKAIVSSIEDGPDGAHRNFLDGYNSPGCAGSPVVYSDDPSGKFKVASVVSSYSFVEQPIYRGNVVLDENVRLNKGIIISYGIQHALEIIRKKPVGISTH